MEQEIGRIREANQRREERTREIATILQERPDAMVDFSEEEINGAIQYLTREVQRLEEEDRRLKEEYHLTQSDYGKLKGK